MRIAYWVLCCALATVVGCDAPPQESYVTKRVEIALPQIARPVNDLTNKLSASETESIARRIVAHHQATGVQIAVLLVETTDGVPMEDYSLRIAESWRGGRARDDRGVLLTLALRDRRSRLEVGYGLEPTLTDSSARAILDDARPLLREGRVAAAIQQMIDRVVLQTGGMVFVDEAPVDPTLPAAQSEPAWASRSSRRPVYVEDRDEKVTRAPSKSSAGVVLILLGLVVVAVVVVVVATTRSMHNRGETLSSNNYPLPYSNLPPTPSPASMGWWGAVRDVLNTLGTTRQDRQRWQRDRERMGGLHWGSSPNNTWNSGSHSSSHHSSPHSSSGSSGGGSSASGQSWSGGGGGFGGGGASSSW